MQLKRIKVRNFLGYGDQPTTMELANQGLVLIVGENGSGKSTLFVNAIPWALFGQTCMEKVYGSTSREFDKNSVINNTTGKDCCVELHFEVNDKKAVIRRYRKDKEKGNIVEFEYDGDNLTKDSIKETDAEIVKTVGMDYNGFVNSIVYGQGPVKRFTQATDAERRAVIDSILRLDIFDKAKKEALEQRKKVNAKMDEMSRDISYHKGSLETNKFQIDKNEIERIRHQGIADRNKEEEETEIAVIEEAIGRAQIDLEDARAKYNSCSEDLTDATARLDEHIEENGTLEELRKRAGSARSQMAGINVSISVARQAIAGIEKELSDEPELCNKCGQELPRKSKKIVKKQLLKEKAEEEMLIEVNENNYTKAFDLAEKLDALVEAQMNLGTNVVESKEMVRRAQFSCDELERRIANKQESISRIRDKRNQSKLVLDMLVNKRKELLADKRVIERALDRSEKDLLATEEEAKYLTFWSDAFGSRGIKDSVIDSSLDYINAELSRFCDILAKGVLTARIYKKIGGVVTLEVRIRGKKMPYVSIGGGRAKRIDLCVAMALQAFVEKRMADTNISIFDEFDAALDQPGVQAFLGFLRTEVERKGSVFVISHNPHVMTEVFDRVYRVENNGGGSHISDTSL